MITVDVLTADEWRTWREIRVEALLEAPEAFGSTFAGAGGPDDHEAYWRGYFRTDGRNFLAYDRTHDGVPGLPVGLVRVVAPSPATRAELMSLWVAPAARRTGTATALVEACWDWVQSVAPGASLTLSVRRRNAAALRLYERLGFALVGPDPEDPAEDVLERRPRTSPVS